jgi:hypothetical protein
MIVTDADTKAIDEIVISLRDAMSASGWKQIRRSVLISGAKMEGAAKNNARTLLNVRTGQLSGSIHFEVTSDSVGTLETRLFSDAKHANLREEGGIVKAKPGKSLRVPLDAAKTAGGVDRLPGPLRVVAPGMFKMIIPDDGGNPLLINVETDEPWYVLVPQTTHKPAHFMKKAVDAELEAMAQRAAKTYELMITEKTTEAANVG